MNELAFTIQSYQGDTGTLSNYSRSQFDKSYADKNESILGHLVFERGYSIKRALESYAPIVKATYRETSSAKDWCQKLGFGSLGIGVLVGAGMGIGFAILPILASTLNLKLWSDSRDEMPRREAEYHLLRTVPNLPELLYSLSLRGCDVVKLIGAYDALITAIEPRIERGDDFSESEVGEFLQTKITSSTGLEVETQVQQGLQISEAQDATNSKTGNLAVTELQAVSPTLQVINGVETIAPRDIATDLGNNPQSALIFGTPGSGKGMNISNAIRAFRAKYPNVTIFMVDPKGDPKERGYWYNQVDTFESKPILKVLPRVAAEWMLDCVDKFRSLDGPKLLIWDELYATVTVLKSQNVATGKEPFPCLTDFQSFLATHLSLGPSSGIWVWGMSQSANLTDLGLTSGGLSTTRIIALVSPDNTGAIEGLYATKAITAPKGGMDTIESLMESSPVGRACYDGKTKRWYPMAKLENHSGFDRDSADWNNLGSSTKTKTIALVPESTTVPTIEPWESKEPIEVDAVEVPQSHPLKDKFDRLETLMYGKYSLPIREIQRAFSCKSDEAQQIAQMFCMKQKSTYRFSQSTNTNGTQSKCVERV